MEAFILLLCIGAGLLVWKLVRPFFLSMTDLDIRTSAKYRAGVHPKKDKRP